MSSKFSTRLRVNLLACCYSKRVRVRLILSRASRKATGWSCATTTTACLIYSIKDGDLRHRFFGTNAAMNPSRSQVIVENYPGELTLYDLANRKLTGASAVSRSGASFVRFSLDGKKLLVLTSGQIAYTFDTSRMSTKGE